MKIIGEKINGTRARIGKAIVERDANHIQSLARRQVEAGAHWLDVNAGTMPAKEPEDLSWLVETVQAVTDAPLCLDSANPEALSTAIEIAQQTPMVNSISGEPERLEKILPIVAEHGCPVIALAMSERQVPSTSEERVKIVHQVMQATRSSGVPDEHVYVDVLAMTLSTNIQSAQITIEAMRGVLQEYPEVHLSLGLSNISFGLPARANINRTFLTLAMAAGLDTAILDPLDPEMQAAILTTNLVLGRDRHCLNYTRAARAGVFGKI